jgi:hypothetical protein
VSDLIEISRSAIFCRLISTGKAALEPNGWAINSVSGWKQGEWISPDLVASFIGHNLARQEGNFLVVTEEGKNSGYRDTGRNHFYVRQVRPPSSNIDLMPTEESNEAKTKPNASKGFRTEPVKILEAAGKLTPASKVRLLRVGKIGRGHETEFTNLWSIQPDKTATVERLASLFESANPMASVRFFVKRALHRGDAEMVS